MKHTVDVFGIGTLVCVAVDEHGDQHHRQAGLVGLVDGLGLLALGVVPILKKRSGMCCMMRKTASGKSENGVMFEYNNAL